MSPSTSAPATRIVFIIHGRHCPDGLPQQLLQPFRDQFSVDVLLTTSASSATRLAREAALSGARWVIAVGGDGTVHEVVNGLMSVPAAQRQQLVLGVLPSGTGNDFVRTLGSGRQLQVDGAAADCPLELDGELCGSAPVTFELVPAALQCLMLPPG